MSAVSLQHSAARASAGKPGRRFSRAQLLEQIEPHYVPEHRAANIAAKKFRGSDQTPQSSFLRMKTLSNKAWLEQPNTVSGAWRDHGERVPAPVRAACVCLAPVGGWFLRQPLAARRNSCWCQAGRADEGREPPEEIAYLQRDGSRPSATLCRRRWRQFAVRWREILVAGATEVLRRCCEHGIEGAKRKLAPSAQFDDPSVRRFQPASAACRIHPRGK